MSKVRFCPKCDNNFSNYMLETNESGDIILYYKCGSCLYREGISQKDLASHAKLYTKNNMNRRPDRVVHIDMCDDPSIPRTSSIKCPNDNCPSHKTGDYEIAQIEYNDERKIAFICCEPKCHSMWRRE
jgi:DNA-directed RNA polymerase subunit M/transcription elongation factor TFIIS